MFTNLFDLAANTVRIVVAPIEAVASVVNDGVKAVADVVEELADDIKATAK
jgi:hypothetical protein